MFWASRSGAIACCICFSPPAEDSELQGAATEAERLASAGDWAAGEFRRDRLAMNFFTSATQLRRDAMTNTLINLPNPLTVSRLMSVRTLATSTTPEPLTAVHPSA